MYPETKEAVRRAMGVCRVLWSMDPEDYVRLLEATDAVDFPSRAAIEAGLRDKFRDEVIGDEDFARLVDAAILEDLKTRYSDAATEAGFEAEQGLAMLEYAAIMRDLEDDDDGYGR
jgi:hypothetical protein